MRSLLSICLILAAAHVMGQQVYDDFSTPNWTATSTRGVNVYEQQGKLKIDFLKTASQSGGAWIQGGYTSTCRLEGNFDVTAEYYAPLFPTGNGMRVGLMLMSTPSFLLGLDSPAGFAVTERVENPDVSVYVSDFFPLPYTVSNAVLTSDTSGRLRLKRVGTELTGYFWDKVARVWVITGRTVSYPTDPVHMILYAWTDDNLFADVAVKVAFDNVKIISGNCVKPL